MSDPIAGWHEEHERFAQVLDLLQREVDAFHRGERPNYELMCDVVYYLRNYADRVHHPREDVAFRRLLAREPEMELLINRLLQEHRVISVAGDELLAHLNEAERDVMAPRTELEAAAATYLVYYRNHLRVEEEQIMPRAANVLTDNDWAQVAATVGAAPDPLFGENVDSRLRELRRQIDREAAIPPDEA